MRIVQSVHSGGVTFVLARCSSEVMWVCTEDADVDKNMLQAAQWKISIFVMWSFSWRADKAKISLHLGFVFNVFNCNILFTWKYTVLYGSATLMAFMQQSFL